MGAERERFITRVIREGKTLAMTGGRGFSDGSKSKIPKRGNQRAFGAQQWEQRVAYQQRAGRLGFIGLIFKFLICVTPAVVLVAILSWMFWGVLLAGLWGHAVDVR